MATVVKSSKREKSALYPPVSIEACIEFITQVDSLGGKTVSYASICDLLGLKNYTTRSFLGKISASKQFGFITTSANTAQLTDLAKRVLYPVDERDKIRILKEALSSPPLYGKLIERFNTKALPNKMQLSNILMNEYKIIKQVKEAAAECFISSAEYVGVVSNGVLLYEITDEETASETTENAASDTQAHKLEANVKSPSQGSGYNFEIPILSGGWAAKVQISEDVLEKDLDFISNTLLTFIENLKEERQKE